MRSYLLLAPILVGCNTTCPTPEALLEGVSWDVFSNVVQYELQGTTRGPPGATPVNGRTQWTFAWGDAAESPVSLTIDGQSYAANGQWDTVECGTFVLDFSGVFLSEDATTHNFTAGGLFRIYDDQIVGDLQWNESWTTGDAVGALLVSESNVRGVALRP